MELTALDILSLKTIWDPDFSLDSSFSFVAASTDAALIYWKKKIRINWPLPPLSDLFHSWQERYVYQITVNTVIKDHFFFSFYKKDENEYLLLYPDDIIKGIKYILEEN